MTYLDTLTNPLWDELSRRYSLGLKGADIVEFGADAAKTAENLFRVGIDGVARPTEVVALYTSQIEIGGTRVQAGLLAQELPRRSQRLRAQWRTAQVLSLDVARGAA